MKKIKLSGLDEQLPMQGKEEKGGYAILEFASVLGIIMTLIPFPVAQIATPSYSASNRGFKNRSHNLARKYWSMEL